MNRYAKGRRAEYKAMRILEEMGWYTYRMASSKGEFDVIAWHPKGLNVRFIQVKAGSKASAADRRKLAALDMPQCGCIELWEFLGRGELPRISTWPKAEVLK